VWNDFLHIFGKQLIKSRVNPTESSRRLSSVLLPNTCFGMLWSDGLRLLLRPSTDRLAIIAELFAPVSDCPTLVPRPSGVRRIGDRDRVSDRACPPAPPVFLLSRAFRVTTLCDIFDVQGSPMTIFLSFLLSSAQGRTMNFLLIGSNVVAGTGGLSMLTSF
jgi:hypothetical protein